MEYSRNTADQGQRTKIPESKTDREFTGVHILAGEYLKPFFLNSNKWNM